MMRTVRVCALRTLGRLLPSPTTLVAMAGFLALSSAMFTATMMRGDGGATPVEALWAVAAVPFLPVLAALLTMRMIAEERMQGRIDLLLTAPILERDIVMGKFLAAMAMLLLTLAVYLVVPLFVLPFFTSKIEVSLMDLLPGLLALALQGALWCAVGLLASACFRHSAAAAFVSLLLMIAFPHASFHAAVAWSPALRARFAEIPFETHVVDMATGLVSLATPLFYGVLAFVALFAAAKALALLRMKGRSCRMARLSTCFAVSLAFTFACLMVAIAVRLDCSFEFSRHSAMVKTSARTRQILAETHGRVQATCFLARKSQEFRAVSRLLRGLEATARSVAGTHLTVEYVDPRWELARATELVRGGAHEGTIVFRRGGRRVDVPVGDLFLSGTNGVVSAGSDGFFAGESACASAIQRLSLPNQKEKIYWTIGHGETTFDNYDPALGMSDVARELRRDGYELAQLDLAAAPFVPPDCAVLVVAAARDAFSKAERQRVESWFETGGRMLVLAARGANAGVGSMLPSWGVKALPFSAVSARTITGTDVVVRDFADHAITRPLSGGMAVFEGAMPLEKTAVNLQNNVTFTPLAVTDAGAWGESEPEQRPWTRDTTSEPGGPLTLAAALERGGSVSSDVALRPSRLVVIGDAAFVSNGALARRGGGNRDLFLNSIAWLAGLDAQTATRVSGAVLTTGMDRAHWMRFGAVSTLGLPFALLLLGGLWVLRRRMN